MTNNFKNIDEYISLQPDAAKEMLEAMRQIINAVVPDAEETISYGMPAFKYHGKMLVYFAGFKKHCSLFPANSSLIDAMEDELKTYRTSKGTIQFELGKRLPIALIKKIVKARAKQNLEKSKK